MGELKVNVIIAGRSYPTLVANELEEEGMRKAAKNINNLISKFEQNYAVGDKQDALAMCALQYASKKEINALMTSEEATEVLYKVNELSKLVESHLK